MSSRSKILLFGAMAVMIAACGQHNSGQKNAAAQGQAAGGQSAMTGGPGMAERRRGGLRNACSSEIEKYCMEDRRKLFCLQDNMDRLGTDCKVAVNVALQRRAERMQNRQQMMNGQQGTMQQGMGQQGTMQRGTGQQPANNQPEGDDQ